MMQAMQRQTGMQQPQRGGFRGRGPQRMPGGRGRGRGIGAMLQRQRGSMGRRGSPQMREAMQRPQTRGDDARRPNPQMMNMMRQKMAQQQGGRRGMVAPGMRGPMKSLGRPDMGGRVQPGGPGGMPGGRPEMLSPGDARMPGGRAMPFRGFQQKQAMQRRGNLGGNRVGQSDQQGGLSRALQRGTGRPPMSRRSSFPGR